jgi:hypothetical protein
MPAFARAAILILAVCTWAGLAVCVAHAATATFAPSADLCMGSMAPYSQNNEGQEYWFPIGDNYYPGPMDCRTIMRFDVSSLGNIPNLQVNSISLRLTSVGIWAYDAYGHLIMDSQLPTDNSNPVHPEIHAILPGNRDWTEGPGNGYSFVPNQSCYVAKKTGTIPGSVVIPWTGSAGLTTPGTDYSSTVLSTKTLKYSDVASIGQTVTFTFSGSSNELTGLINTWLADNMQSRDNPGLIMFDPATSTGPAGRRVGFFSLQCTNPPAADTPTPAVYPASYRPQLIVNYSQVPEPGTLVLLASGFFALLARTWRKCK